MGFVFGPEWFYGTAAVFEFIVMLITLFIAVYSFRIYFIVNDRKYLYFTLAFLFIAASFFIRAVTDYMASTHLIGRMPNVVAAVSTVATVPQLHSLGYLAHVFLMFAGFMILVAIFLRIHSVMILSLLFIFIIVLTALSQSKYYAFHITLIVMLIYIVLHLLRNYVSRRKLSPFLVLYSMACLLVAQIFFMFVFADKLYYVIGHIIQMAGFLLLLFSLMLVLRR